MYNFILISAIMALITTKTLTVKSPVFASGESIPSKYTCEGDNINPEIRINDIPSDAACLALIMDDPDAPNGTFDHWIMWNIPVTEKIPENSTPGAQGKNGRGQNKYTGPCPPTGTHHYHFKVYALDKKLDLPVNTDKGALLKAMEGHIISQGELVGVYKKNNQDKK